MRIFWAAVLTALLVSGFVLEPVVFAVMDPEVAVKIQALEQELALLKRKVEVDREVSFNNIQKTPIITAGPGKDGFSIKSPDSAYKLKIGGYTQGDGRYFVNNQEAPGTTTQFLIRKARLTFDGTVAKYFDFRFMPDFGQGSTVVQDAYVEFNNWKAFKPRVGKFKSPFGLERLQSDVNNTFIELGLPSNLVPNRDIGAQVSGEVFNGAVTYAAGIFNGAQDGASLDTDSNNNKDAVARIFAEPFKNSDIDLLNGLGLGVAGSYGHQETTLPSYRTPAQATFFSYGTGTTINGSVTRFSPQAYYYYGPFGFLGEYVVSQQEIEKTAKLDKIVNKAWQLMANYVLTGEKASYSGVKPLKPFLKDGGIGAVEVAARVGGLNVDQDVLPIGFANPATSAEKALEWGLALNWYLNSNVKLGVNLERTTFSEGGSVGGPDRESENALLSRLQLTF